MQLETLAQKYAHMQHEAADQVRQDPSRLLQHISATLCRCLPACVVTSNVANDCLIYILSGSSIHDPMYTAAIHAFAGQYLLHAESAESPILQKLYHAAKTFLPQTRSATREDLRLVTLAALYTPGCLHSGEAEAFVRQRLGLRDGIRRSCEEISIRMHRPLIYIHELESAVLFALSSHHSGGSHA